MFLIFGFGHQTNNTSQLKEFQHCYHCNNNVQWVLNKRTSWFTLFFIPIFPFKISYELFCPICRNTIILSKREYERKKII